MARKPYKNPEDKVVTITATITPALKAKAKRLNLNVSRVLRDAIEAIGENNA